MYGGVHFQECYNRDGGYYSNMIILFVVFHNYFTILTKIYWKFSKILSTIIESGI